MTGRVSRSGKITVVRSSNVVRILVRNYLHTARHLKAATFCLQATYEGTHTHTALAGEGGNPTGQRTETCHIHLQRRNPLLLHFLSEPRGQAD